MGGFCARYFVVLGKFGRSARSAGSGFSTTVSSSLPKLSCMICVRFAASGFTGVMKCTARSPSERPTVEPSSICVKE